VSATWGKAIGLTILGLSAVGLALLAMGGSDEPSSGSGIPVTENPPEDVTDTDDEEGDDDGEST